VPIPVFPRAAESICAPLLQKLDDLGQIFNGLVSITIARDDLKLGLGLQRDGVPIGARPALVVG
jgi:hypothetical protein